MEFSHVEAGAAPLELWGFSEAVVTEVRYQPKPEMAPGHQKLCRIIATPRWARPLFCVPEKIIPELPNQEWLDAAGMPRENFNDWLTRARFRHTIACSELRIA